MNSQLLVGVSLSLGRPLQDAAREGARDSRSLRALRARIRAPRARRRRLQLRPLAEAHPRITQSRPRSGRLQGTCASRIRGRGSGTCAASRVGSTRLRGGTDAAPACARRPVRRRSRRRRPRGREEPGARHHFPGRLPHHPRRLARHTRDRLRLGRGAGCAHAGDLSPRQQRHALPHGLQPALRQGARLRRVLPRPRLPALRALGARLPGRPVRSPGRPDDPLVGLPHLGRERARPAGVRPCRARPHRRRAGRHRRAQPRRHGHARVAAPGPRLRTRPLARHRGEPAPRDHQLLAVTAQLLAAAGLRRLHAGKRGLCRARRGRHAVPEHAQHGRRDAGPDPLPGDPGHRRRLRLPALHGRRFPGVPSLDRDGDPADFSRGPELAGATNLGLAGQGVYDVLGTAHLGVWSSPETWRATLQFLRPQNP